MEDECEVDLSIIKNIDSTISLIEDQENSITKEMGVNTTSSFLSYHVLRNVRLALFRMKERFLLSKQTNDNPVVAQESLQVLPILAELTEIALEEAGKQLSAEKEDMIIERIRIMRHVLRNASMLITPEAELKTLSQKSIKDEADELTELIQKKYTEEDQDIHRN
jgi:hypothetical protein